MIRVWGVVGLVLVSLWICCLFDVGAADDRDVRLLPKSIWFVLVLFLPPLGPTAWLILGRPQPRWTPSTTDYGASRRPVGPEDTPWWTTGLPASEADRNRQLRAWEADLQRREDELRRREKGD